MLEIRHSNMDNTLALLKAYDEIYSSIGIQHLDSFYLWLISLLRPEVGKILVDVSCGQGRLVSLAQRMGIRTVGVDFSIEGLYIGHKHSPNSGWVAGDGECLPIADQSVDYVTHIGSLEHYMDPQKGASEIARILKPSGGACILLPNAFGLWGNIRHVWRTGEVFDDGQPLQRYATRRTWETLLIKGGLKIVDVMSYGEVVFPRTIQDAVLMIRRPRKILRYFLNLFIPLNLANHLVFICTKDQKQGTNKY